MSFDFLLGILGAAVGLGLLIFVHELGHFLVAKWCGVKCEKFMVGFDVGGLKLSRKWGETVYGIGIVPLGGYVKMLGQDDNPANIAEQLERSQIAGEEFDGVEVVGPSGEKYLVDRRSYMAKNVPQRMAIISAGVIMNVIFAVVFATIAFGLGVREIPCVISKTVPGSVAWQAGLQTGDEIRQIGEVHNPSFMQLRSSVTLADLEAGVPLVIDRAGSEGSQNFTLKPQKQNGRGLAKIGIASASSLKLFDENPTVPGSIAANIEDGFQGGDVITAVDGQPVENYRQLAALLATHVDQPLQIEVQRKEGAGSSETDSESATATKTITLPPNPQRRFGLVMEMGPVVAIQDHSPASQAGLETGQPIRSISAGEQAPGRETADSPLDPMTLPARVQQLVQEDTEIELSIGAGDDATSVAMQARRADWLESADTPETPISIPELGIAYEVLNTVESVLPASPAAKAGLKPGDKLVDATLLIPEPDGDATEEMELELGDALNWPMIIGLMQELPTGTRLELSYERDGATSAVTLESAVLDDPVYVAERGLLLEPLTRIRKAASFGEQLSLGWNKTWESLSLVYRFLQRLWEGQVPATALGGPIEIAKMAYASTGEGLSTLLMFMTLLSANLAVVNFLPIPVLDGGHMVFLAYEGIFRRPPNERIVVGMHMVGLVLILGLMSFLILLDVGVIPRKL